MLGPSHGSREVEQVLNNAEDTIGEGDVWLFEPLRGDVGHAVWAAATRSLLHG